MIFFRTGPLSLAISLIACRVSGLTLAQDVCDELSLASVSLTNLVPDTPTLENLVIRQNGEILVSSVGSPKLHQVSPSNLYPPVTVVSVPGFTGLLGITELERDVFYVVSSNLTGAKYSNAVWKVDLGDFSVLPTGLATGAARLSHVVDIPDAVQLNGMTRLNKSDKSHLLISDSGNGTVVRLNVHTGEFDIVLQDSSMAPLSSGLGIGINGIHTFHDNLYFTNLDQKLFARIPISASGLATGPADIIATNITNQDDFALSPRGTYAWIATNGPMELIEVDIMKKTKRVKAFSPFLGSASSVATDFTNSSQALYVTGSLAIGNSSQGQLASVDLSE